MYRHASSLPDGKEDPEFVKKPDLALELINRCLKRGMSPSVILMDAAYGNNTPFLAELETKKLIYVAAVAKNRNVYTQLSDDSKRLKQKLEDVARTLALENFEPVQLPLDKPRSVWVAVLPVHVPKLTGTRTLAIQMNAPTFEQATEVDYFITNAPHEIATNKWIVKTYSTRNWVEVFYREAKGWLGLTEYQVRSAASIEKHWIIVFTAYTFIIWHQLTGGLRRRWSNKSIDTFASAVEAFRTAVEYRLFSWLSTNVDVFAAHKAKYGFIWA